MNEIKHCSRCGCEKSLLEFNRRSKSKDGYRYECRSCQCESQKLYFDLNKDKINNKIKLYYAENKEKKSKVGKKYYKNNIEKINEYRKSYNTKNKDNNL